MTHSAIARGKFSFRNNAERGVLISVDEGFCFRLDVDAATERLLKVCRNRYFSAVKLVFF